MIILKECLKDLIGIYDDSICCGIEDIEEQNKARILVGEIIILLTKLQLNMKCCDNPDCPASVKSHLRRLFEMEEKEIKNYIPYPCNQEFLLSLIQ